jgi:hypothetical protein
MGIYKDGKLMDEAHSLTYEDLASVLGITIKTIEADQEWLEDRGRLPCNLNEVKEK